MRFKMGPFSTKRGLNSLRMKFGNQRVTSHPGMSFASKLEAKLYDQLLLQQKAGEISNIQCQDQVYLTLARIRCIPDFKFYEASSRSDCWAEAKGYETERWPMIKKLWKYYGPGKLYIYKGTYKNLRLDELITPYAHE